MGTAALGRAGADRSQWSRHGCAADRLLKIITAAGCLSVTDAASKMGVSATRVHELRGKLQAKGLIHAEKAPAENGCQTMFLMLADEDWRAVDLRIMGGTQERIIDAIRELGPEASPSAIGEMVGLSSAAVCMSIKALERKGLIERRIRLVEKQVVVVKRVRELVVLDDED